MQAALKEVQQQLQAEREHRARLEQQLQGTSEMPRGCTQDAAAQASPCVAHCAMQTGMDDCETPGTVAVEADGVEEAAEVDSVEAAVEADGVAGAC